MYKMTLERAKEVLKEMYESRKGLQNEGYFPWDRGYREGYTDSVRYACELLGRVKSEE